MVHWFVFCFSLGVIVLLKKSWLLLDDDKLITWGVDPQTDNYKKMVVHKPTY